MTSKANGIFLAAGTLVVPSERTAQNAMARDPDIAPSAQQEESPFPHSNRTARSSRETPTRRGPDHRPARTRRCPQPAEHPQLATDPENPDIAPDSR